WPVTLGAPNAYGLYGIAANVHEWCADWHATDYYAASPPANPQGPATGRRRSSRGGSWRHAVTISRSAARSKIDPAFRYTDYGFRTARSLGARPFGLKAEATRWKSRSRAPCATGADARSSSADGPAIVSWVIGPRTSTSRCSAGRPMGRATFSRR